MGAFDKIIGYEAVKKKLERTADALRRPDAYARFGTRPPQGLLLHGSPGVGKTLMANCLIEESGREAFTCRRDKPDNVFLNTIKSTFARAKENAPSIVFLDDLDKFANEDEHHPNAPEYVAVQSCIDELGESDVFVLATANAVYQLPESLQRAGRLGDRIRIECPGDEDAEKIIAHYLSGKRGIGEIDTAFLARVMSGHSCADLEEAVNAAGLLACFEHAESITEGHLLRAILQTLHGVSGLSFDAPDSSARVRRERERVAWHEAGHVVVAEALDPGGVTLASLYKRFKTGTEGITLCHHSDVIEGLELTRVETLVALGSRAAIERRFGEVDWGGGRDLDQAFRNVRRLIGYYCTRGFGLRNENDPRMPRSQDLTSRVEQAVALEMERYYQEAKSILCQNAALLDAVAQALLEKSLLTMRDIAEISEKTPPVFSDSGARKPPQSAVWGGFRDPESLKTEPVPAAGPPPAPAGLGSGRPHSPQTLASGGFSAPQSGQAPAGSAP